MPTVRASDFGQWRVGLALPVTTVSVQGQVAPAFLGAASGGVFPAVATNAPLFVGDGATEQETLTPSAVTFRNGSYLFNATFTKAHPQGASVVSGSYGLQEAINYVALNGGGSVVVDSLWKGTNAILNAASVPSTVSIIDQRTNAVIVIGSQSSTTPGTVRQLYGKITSTATMTTGNLVGSRGECNAGSVNGNVFLYGSQGKLIVTGTVAGSGWLFGAVGQLDVSAATLTSGSHIGALWGDFGTTGPAVTASFANLLVLTNTTATTLGSHVYTYGKASVVFDLNANGSACLDASSTAAGSVIGHILVSIDGVAGVLRVYSGS